MDPLETISQSTSALVSDALDRIGIRDHTLDPAIRPLEPGRLLLGRALPVVVVASDRMADPPYVTEIHALDALQAGEVPVYCVPREVETALWGELFTCAAMGRGAVGAVVDGSIRDARQIRELGFPLFTRGFSPLDTLGRAEVEAFGVPADCGGVRIEPGDLIVGDEDGVVVVPAAAAPEVAAIVAEKCAGEGLAREDLLAGATLSEVWDRHHVL